MSYEKTIWETGDIVTADKLNNLEDGVENAQQDTVVFDITPLLEAQETQAAMTELVTKILTDNDGKTVAVQAVVIYAVPNKTQIASAIREKKQIAINLDGYTLLPTGYTVSESSDNFVVTANNPLFELYEGLHVNLDFEFSTSDDNVNDKCIIWGIATPVTLIVPSS